MSVTLILKLIDGILLLAATIPSLFQKASLLKEKLQVFVDEGRDPSAAEWDVLNADTDDLMLFMRQRAEAAQAHLDMMAARDND